MPGDRRSLFPRGFGAASPPIFRPTQSLLRKRSGWRRNGCATRPGRKRQPSCRSCMTTASKKSIAQAFLVRTRWVGFSSLRGIPSGPGRLTADRSPRSRAQDPHRHPSWQIDRACGSSGPILPRPSARRPATRIVVTASRWISSRTTYPGYFPENSA
jgi:hypothetical protein